jgi:hypothetical protein
LNLPVFLEFQRPAKPVASARLRFTVVNHSSGSGSPNAELILCDPPLNGEPVTGINGLAFAFKDYDTVWKAMDGDLGAFIREAIAKVNLHSFDRILDNGFRNITSSTKPINNADDLKGFKASTDRKMEDSRKESSRARDEIHGRITESAVKLGALVEGQQLMNQTLIALNTKVDRLKS